MGFKWKITKDKISESGCGCAGQGSFDETVEMTEKFRLKDGDGAIYFYGVSNDSQSQAAFTPLDDFGGAFGCTAIEYYDRKTKSYEVL